MDVAQQLGVLLSFLQGGRPHYRSDVNGKINEINGD